MKKYILISLALLLLTSGSVFYFLNNKNILKTDQPDVDYLLVEDLSVSLRKGNVENSVSIAEDIYKRNPSDGSRILLANVYLEKGSLEFKEKEYADKALVLINEVIKNNSRNAEAYLAAGYAYEILQDYEKSFENYNEAINIEPNNDIAYVKRGHAYDLFGNLELAEQDYLKAYEINPVNDMALLNLARIYQRKSEWEKALSFANQAFSVSRIDHIKSMALEIIGIKYMEVDQDFDTAIKYFDESIRIFDKTPNVFVNRAYGYIQKYDYDISEKNIVEIIEQDLKKALSINKNDSFAHVVYGLLMESIQDYEKALDFYKTAIDLVDVDITFGNYEKQEFKMKINQLIEEL